MILEIIILIFILFNLAFMFCAMYNIRNEEEKEFWENDTRRKK